MSIIVNNIKLNNCASIVKELIPVGSVIGSHALFDGKIEFSLANDNRFVNAHTSSKQIFIFWKCMMLDPKRVYSIVASDTFKFDNTEGSHKSLQESWHNYTNSPFLLSSLFFMLNRTSDTGLASFGNIDLSKLSPVVIQKIKTFQMPDNFHVSYLDKEFIELVKDDSSDYLFVPAGDFDFGLFEHGKSVAVEETHIKHRELLKIFNEKQKKIVASYNFSEKALNAYSNHNTILVDKYGRETVHKERAKEIVIANF